MTTILRFIYRIFAAKFQDFLVEDFIKDIPADARHDFFSVLQNQKRQFQRANAYMAYSLHRKMATDPKNSERYQGMFLHIRLMDVLIAGRPEPQEASPAQKESKKKEEFNYDKTIEEFVAGGKKKNNPEPVSEE